jgi:hypothetical protein
LRKCHGKVIEGPKERVVGAALKNISGGYFESPGEYKWKSLGEVSEDDLGK